MSTMMSCTVISLHNGVLLRASPVLGHERIHKGPDFCCTHRALAPCLSSLTIKSEPGISRLSPLYSHGFHNAAFSRGRNSLAFSLRATSSGTPVPYYEPGNSMGESDSFSSSSGYISNSANGEMDSWDVYDAEEIGKYYRRRPFLLARRLLQIGLSLGQWIAKRWLDSKLGKSNETFKERASELRGKLVELGPAFVKIAQAVSSRPDVIPVEYLQELALLQDRIPPFSTELALEIVEKELGVPIEELFSEISPQPVAAASLGQVYEARLRPNGQAVAVKVQRPGVKAAIALDVFILRILAGLIRKTLKLNTDLQAVVDEWASSLFKEMDYQAEAQNGIRFRRLFGELPDVVVPEMFPELTSQRVLVMEWIEGQRLSEVSDIRLVEVGVYCSLTQLLDSGFYHADPHPGNLLRTADGKLAYLDFGMMGEIKQDLREALIEASVHLVNREFDALAGDFVNLGLLPPNSKVDNVAKALTGVFQDAIRRGVRNISFGDLSVNLGKTMYAFKFRIPAYFSLVVRSLTVLEGIALSSEPDYKVLSSSYPWIARKVLTDTSPQLRNTLKSLIFKDGEFRFDRLESLLSESTRPMFGSQSASTALVSTDSARVAELEQQKNLKKILTFALSEEGEFVRETLLDEIAKGLDAFNRAAVDAAAENLYARLPLGLPRPRSLLSEEDWVHLVNLRRLGQIIARSTSTGAGDAALPSETYDDELALMQGMTLEELQASLGGVARSLQVLPRVGAIASELPGPAQQQALALPLSLAGRYASRLLARAIRSSIPRPAAAQAP
eukprot:TRINITY_DN2529_c0_g1_i1.p1 TRINITY_DN2529_c0_g1~~TRINITY_DN2529_c0_g1_i1.p1  ORF type:complete len:787 (-),score=123.61 TRINITY_DN2529_c0_g1_i1:392-2752(-)